MFNFNLTEAAIYQAVRWSQVSTFRFVHALKKLFLVLFILVFLIFLYGFLSQVFSPEFSSFLLGISIIFLTLSLTFWLKETFFNSKLKEPKIKLKIEEVITRPEEFNLAEFLSFEVARAVSKSLKFVKTKKIAEVNSSTLFYFLLVDNSKLNFIFSHALLNLKEIKEILFSDISSLKTSPAPESREENFLYSKDFQETILEALKIAQQKAHRKIEIVDVLIALAKLNLIFKKILIESNLKVEDIENLTWWLESLERKTQEEKKWWEYSNLMRYGSIAKDWAAGYTITLDQYSTDLSELMKKAKFPEHIGHEKEIKALERILARSEINNCLLVGEPGVGKKAIVQGFQVRSLLGQSLPELNYKRVVILDIPFLLAKITEREIVEATLDKIFQETITAGNVILTINDFHNFVGEQERPGLIDISGIISPYLQSPKFQLIAITTYDGLHKNIERMPALLALFEKVEVGEISSQETLQLLENLALKLEWKYRKLKKFISYSALKEIITLCQRYLPALPFPKKAIDLLDEVMVYVVSLREKIVLPEQVDKIFSEKFQIPVGEIETKEREVLLNLENLIHQRIIDQEEAVKDVSTAMRRAKADLAIRKGPIGAFLFLGPTGVGKTETAKALAEIYFGSEEKMIRLDMSEFQNINDIPRLISSPTEEGLLTTQVRENPFSLILLDEIEKAHPNILNLFLQVFDEGHLTDGLGRKVDFKNSIIIATSNAGYQIILEAIKQKIDWFQVKKKLLDYLFAEGIFRPEFINRFDGVVVFKPLTKENLLDIAELMLQKLRKNLKEKGIDFIISLPLKEKIVELGYSPVFGAREMRRVIQDKVENVLAQAILSGLLKRGKQVEIDPEEFKLKINPQF